MKQKTLFYNFISFSFCAILHSIIGNLYLFIAPLVEEPSKYFSSLPEKNDNIVYSYAIFGFMEFAFYVIMHPTINMYFERLAPFAFHLFTGIVTWYFDKLNKRPIALLINVILHGIVLCTLSF